MNNYKFVIQVSLFSFLQYYNKYNDITLTKQQKLKSDIVYKNGNVKKSGLKFLENELMHLFESYIVDIRNYEKGIEIYVNNDYINIVFDWGKMKFDKFSDYNNVYDFKHNFYIDIIRDIVNQSYSNYDLNFYRLS